MGLFLEAEGRVSVFVNIDLYLGEEDPEHDEESGEIGWVDHDYVEREDTKASEVEETLTHFSYGPSFASKAASAIAKLGVKPKSLWLYYNHRPSCQVGVLEKPLAKFGWGKSVPAFIGTFSYDETALGGNAATAKKKTAKTAKKKTAKTAKKKTAKKKTAATAKKKRAKR